MIEVGRHAAPFPDGLTSSSAKALLFSVDTYFTEAWAQIGERSDDPTAFAHEHGMLILKPDAFAGRRVTAILGWLDERGFKIACARAIRFDRHAIRALWRYQWNMATAERKALFDALLTLTDSVLIVVRGEADGSRPTTVRLTDGKGPSEVEAREAHHLRTRLGGRSAIFTFLHTADEPADVVRELGVLLDPAARAELIDSLLRGEDGAAEARRLCDRLLGEVPEHSLEPPARGGVELSRWDRLAVTAAQIEATIPGIDPVLRTKARDWDAMSAPAPQAR